MRIEELELEQHPLITLRIKKGYEFGNESTESYFNVEWLSNHRHEKGYSIEPSNFRLLIFDILDEDNWCRIKSI